MKNTTKFIAAFILSMFLMVPATAATTVLNSDEIAVVQAPEKDKKEKKECKKECEKKCSDKKSDAKKEEKKAEKAK